MKIASWGAVYEAWNRVKDTGITWTLANFRETSPWSRGDHPKDHHRDKITLVIRSFVVGFDFFYVCLYLLVLVFG